LNHYQQQSEEKFVVVDVIYCCSDYVLITSCSSSE